MVVLTSEQMDNLLTIYNNTAATHPGADFYRALADMMDEAFLYPDVPPVEYLTAIQWLRGAADVNENSGSQSNFIRSYNKAQIEARYGETLSDAEMDAVSNAIADRIFQQIVGYSDAPGTAAFPTLNSLAQDDAAPAAETIFKGDLGGWAGNHLFLVLGYSTAFYSNIMEAGSSTYDAVAMIKFTNESFGVGNWWDAFSQFLSYPSGAITYLSAMTDLDGFIMDAYSCIPHSDYLSGRTLIGTFDNIILGLIDQVDTLTGTSGRDLIQGGGGADTILGSLGADILDGAEGKDVVDYSSFQGGRIFTLTGDVESTADYVGYVTGTGATDLLQASLFGIENIIGGASDDVFRIESLPGILERIDGGGQGEIGDTLDLSALTSNTGVAITLQGGEGGAGRMRVDLSQIAVSSFENVIGSERNDSIKGSEGANVIQGGAGDDTIDGGGGADLLSGGAGADTLNIDLVGATGPVIVWGGDGADTLSITTDGETQLGIMMVNVTDLTEENFHQLDLEALGMPDDFDWSKIGAIVVNAESDDDITYNGQSLRGHEEKVIAQDRVWYSVLTDNPEPSTVAWANALKAAGYKVAFEETFTFAEGNEDMDGSYYFAELLFEAETSETYMAIGSQVDGTLCEVNSVQGTFLSGSQNFNILTPAVFRPVVAVYQDTESDYNSINRDLPVSPILVTPTISYSYTPEGAEEAIDVSFIVEFFRIGYHAYPDGWMEEPGGIFIPPAPGSDAVDDFYFGYMTSEEIVFNTAETIGEWYVVGGKMDENGGIISDDTITISLGEDPVTSAARHDFL